MTQDFTEEHKASPALQVPNAAQLNALNTVGTISYVLHLIVAVGALIPGGQLGPVLLVAALVLDLIKREDAYGTWHASHFRWRIRTVMIAAILYLLTTPLWFVFLIPGWMAWFLISAWFFYRIVKGMVRMNRGLAMEMTQ
jgi:uncharacterized membrane protein